MSRLHATFEPSSHGWVFRDAGSTHGSYLEDGEQTGRLVIAPGRTVRLRLGDAMGDTIEVEALDELREVATGPPSQAVTQLGRLSGVHRLVATRVRIGRDPDNDLVLEDLQVSRRHAELLGTGERWELRDLGSHNGTYVNGRSVTTAVLSPGDVDRHRRARAAVHRRPAGRVPRPGRRVAAGAGSRPSRWAAAGRS